MKTKEKINHPKHYNFGEPEVIEIIDAWGLIGDFDAGNVLKYFLRAPYKKNEEEDYRKAMWYLERIYKRDGACDILTFNNQTFTSKRIRHQNLLLEWVRPINNFKSSKNKDITLDDVITGWNLTGNRQFFIEYFYYKNFNCQLCMKVLGSLIDEVAEIMGDENL